MIARIVDEKTQKTQLLKDHLFSTASLCRDFLAVCGFGETGYLLGLLHDIGKYSEDFQNYIQSIAGLLKSGDPGFVPNAEKMRGKIPHAAAGAWFWKQTLGKKPGPLLEILMEMPVIDHHSFLEDVIQPDGDSFFLERKPEDFKGLDRIFERMEPEVRDEIKAVIAAGKYEEELLKGSTGKIPFKLGLRLRLLYSALIDADRTDAAGGQVCGNFSDWGMLAECLECHLAEFRRDTELDRIRADISSAALQSASLPQGIYRFTIPTGGGKTLAGLRFALHHAERHHLKRVVYAAPFLSILEQNADSIRKNLDDLTGKYVLECHSGILPEMKKKYGEEPYSRISENWDAPIICTSMVQILNAMFSGESRYVRRFHQLAESVIILDEIQCLPVEMTCIFNRVLNYLATELKSTVVLCSATQPDQSMISKNINRIHFAENAELYQDYGTLFRQLKRVNTVYVPGQQTNESIADFADEKFAGLNSLLLICNTKPHAAEMFRLLHSRHPELPLFHLSTNLCPAHRKALLVKIREKLKNGERIMVVSTSLIEAGVDISFECVIRMMTSLDSIVQAAGRCNRNAERESGEVYILENPAKLHLTPSVSFWSVSTKNALEQYRRNPEKYDCDILSPKLLKMYYENLYSHLTDDELAYGVRLPGFVNDTLLNLLGSNSKSGEEYQRLHDVPYISLPVRGAFETAGKAFKALDDLTSASVIVPYCRGKAIIAKLAANPEPEQFNKLLKKAQLYSVGVTEYTEKKLRESGAVYELNGDYGILAARESDYDVKENLGLMADSGHLSSLNY